MDINEILKDVRKDIDEIDAELIPLFTKRMDCSLRVAEIKQKNGIPVYAPEREKAILDKVRKIAGEKYGDGAASLYSSIMGISREYQHKFLDNVDEMMNKINSAPKEVVKAGKEILCQGVQGAYSNIAATKFFGEKADINFCPSFADVFKAIEDNQADYGVVPMENSAAGSVADVYSLIIKYKYYIVGAVNVYVRHCLAAKKDAKVKKVLSHPQALTQCTEYIENNKYEPVEFSNTAAAAKFVAESEDNTIAAICSREAAEKYGLTILEDGVQDAKNNHTRFAVISKNACLPENAQKISLIISIPNTPGSLYQVLERFARNGLNLTKIESRPIKNSNFDYEFYLDFTGNIHNSDVLSLIASLYGELESFTFLGNYEEI